MFLLVMAIAMISQTITNVILMVGTAVCQMLQQITAQIAHVITWRLVLLDFFLLQLVMDTAMMRQTMFTAYMMALTAVGHPLMQRFALIVYVMVSQSLLKISFFL